MKIHTSGEKPSQLELAHLATRFLMNGRSYQDSVKEALELWEAAGKALNPPPNAPARRKWLPFDDFLREVFPKRQKDYREERFHEYIRGLVEQNPGSFLIEWRDEPIYNTLAMIQLEATDDRICDAVGKEMRRFKDGGVEDPDELRIRFGEWMKMNAQRKRAKTRQLGRKK